MRRRIDCTIVDAQHDVAGGAARGEVPGSGICSRRLLRIVRLSEDRQRQFIQTKVEELEEMNQSVRQRDKVKDDAIAQLSDQLVSLSARLQEIERRQG